MGFGIIRHSKDLLFFSFHNREESKLVVVTYSKDVSPHRSYTKFTTEFPELTTPQRVMHWTLADVQQTFANPHWVVYNRNESAAQGCPISWNVVSVRLMGTGWERISSCISWQMTCSTCGLCLGDATGVGGVPLSGYWMFHSTFLLWWGWLTVSSLLDATSSLRWRYSTADFE